MALANKTVFVNDLFAPLKLKYTIKVSFCSSGIGVRKLEVVNKNIHLSFIFQVISLLMETCVADST